ncbi:MAG TPA: accessory factor UbiK family protein [Gammaproteobacteria bacterium]|nr:accessory factor UbiK family protein [Gammaproteobacteria bacterium]
MDKLNFLNDLSKKLSEALPKNLQLLKKDIEKNFHIVLANAFSKLDLVTRDEFDAQTKVLARSRKKIEKLEEKIKELEKLIDENKSV